ncbi:MAG: hypothetical protein JWQ18_3723 [Conexibacter sp.]|nr:hypothetical protein [Conexibacter sp.]
MNTSQILTRRTLVGLAIFTLIDFAITAAMGNPKHGLRGAVADVTWMTFLVCVLLLIVASAFVLVRSSTGARRRRAAP